MKVQVSIAIVAFWMTVGCGPENARTVETSTAAVSATSQSYTLLTQVQANATCTMYPNPNDQSVSHVVEADAQGLVRFTVSGSGFQPNDSLGFIDCPNKAGGTDTVELTFGATMSKQSSLQAQDAAAMATWVIRPALTVDPNSISQSDLIRRGFPPRPDSQRAPVAYDNWLQMVSVAARKAPVSLRPHSGSYHNTSQVWCAAGIAKSGAKYDSVTGYWPSPSVTGANGDDWTESSMWVGIDGWGSADVVQDGTDDDVSHWVENGNQHSTAYYDACVEWYPANTVFITGFAVTAGDDIVAEAWVGDSTGDLTPSGGYGWYNMYNYNTNAYFVTSVAKPSGTTFSGNIAEAVLERPDGETYGLADFGTASIATFSAEDSSDGNLYQHDFSSDTNVLISMTEDGSAGGTVLCSPAATGEDATFTWHAFY